MAQLLRQIGEVSARTGLSLRTIRHYEEVGLVRPTVRSAGGFRLYTEGEVRRLNLIRRMRPLGFSLENVRTLLEVLDRLPEAGGPPPDTDREAHEELVARLRKYWVEADLRCEDLRRELTAAENFARSLHTALARLIETQPAAPEAHTS